MDEFKKYFGVGIEEFGDGLVVRSERGISVKNDFEVLGLCN